MFSKNVNRQDWRVYRCNQAKSIENVTETIKRLCHAFCVLLHLSLSPCDRSKKGTGRGENAKRLKWERYWGLLFPFMFALPRPLLYKNKHSKFILVQSLQVDPVLDLCQSCQSWVNHLTQRFITLIPSSSKWSFSIDALVAMCWGDSLACACVACVSLVSRVSFVFFLTEEERRRLCQNCVHPFTSPQPVD